MDHPFGHHNHHHHRRDDDDEYDNNNSNSVYPPPPPASFGTTPYPPPPQVYPPPSYGGAYDPPPPSGIFHSSHHTPPPPHLESQNYPPPQQPHHEYGRVEEEEERPHHGFRPHMPAFIQHHFNEPSDSYHDHSSSGGPGYGGGDGVPPHVEDLSSKHSHKIYSKAGGDRFNIAIRDGKLVLAHPDHNDPTQHWWKDERYSTRVKDKEGYPSFILVNKGTGQAAKHPISGHPVQLVPYKPDVMDESVLWTESKDLGSGFRCVRTVNNIKLVMDAWNADKNHGGIRDGTLIALFDVWRGDNQNQQWKIVPF